VSAWRGAVLATASVLLAGTTLVPAAPAAAPPLASLEGYFLLVGRVTHSFNVPGEHRGETFTRTWLFLPTCPAGACQQVLLERGGRNAPSLVLRRRSASLYTGAGSFTAPLRCGRSVVRRGETVPFSISVRITAVQPVGTQLVATGIRATYTNPRRINHTRCVPIPARESASYTLRRPTFR
jgi:hypothetical protein